jgi:hypothetical protein
MHHNIRSMKGVYKCLLHELDYFACSCSTNYMGSRFTGQIVAALDIYPISVQ